MGCAMRAAGKYRVWHTHQGSFARIRADWAAIATHLAIETSSAGRRQAKKSTPPTPAKPSAPGRDSWCPPAKTLRTNSGCHLSYGKKPRSTTNCVPMDAVNSESFDFRFSHALAFRWFARGDTDAIRQ